MRPIYSRQFRPATFAVSAIALVTATAITAKNWTDWTSPSNLQSVNSSGVDGCASISPDGTELWFTSTRGGGAPDIYVSRRESPDDPWGAAENVGAPINTPVPEACPTMTRGGRLYFTRQGPPDPSGDIYVVRLGPKGWGTPERLGPNINRNGSIEESPSFFEDGGKSVMYFSSNREGRNRIYQSVDGGPAELVLGGVASLASDARPTVRKDGLEIFFDSSRGANSNIDLWTASRASVSEPWGDAVRLPFSSSEAPGGFFQPGFDARPSISWDGSEMVFASFRSGGSGVVDIYTTRRAKSRTGPKEVRFD